MQLAVESHIHRLEDELKSEKRRLLDAYPSGQTRERSGYLWFRRGQTPVRLCVYLGA